MLTLGYKKAEKFVREQRELGNDIWWENYTMCFFRPDPKGVYSVDGMFRDGEWGFKNTVEVDDNGLWNIDWRNVKRDHKHNRPTRT